MALIKCPECGKEISDKAASCPGCGYPIFNVEKNEPENSDVMATTDNSKLDVNNQNATMVYQPTSITYCSNCGEKLELGSTYCMKCGYEYSAGQTKQTALDPKEMKKLKKRKSKYEKLAEFFSGEVLLIAILIMIFGARIITFRIATFSQIIGIVFYSINVGSKDGTHKARSIVGIIGYTIVTLLLIGNTIIRPDFEVATNLYVESVNQTYEWAYYMQHGGASREDNPLGYATELSVLLGYFETLTSSANEFRGYYDSMLLCERFYYSDLFRKNDTINKSQAIAEYAKTFQ